MTETLSHIALRRLNGAEASNYYVPFDSVEVSLNNDHCLVIHAPLVCNDVIVTNDIAELGSDSRCFRILGRKDNVICSGGIKIQIEELERLLKPHIPVPFMVTKVKDEKFGEVGVLLLSDHRIVNSVVLRNVGCGVWSENTTGKQNLLYEDSQTKSISHSTFHIPHSTLPPYWSPRHTLFVDHLPMTATGKPARKEAEELARKLLEPQDNTPF